MDVLDNTALMIEQFCDEYGLSFRSDYVGRGMMRRSCVGFVSGNPLTDLASLVDYIHNMIPEDVVDVTNDEFKNDIQMDSMGLDHIVYFPRVQYPEIKEA